MMLKCCTQYVGKFKKLTSDHRTGKGQFSFQSQRRAMPKNVQTTIQLHSFHMLVRLCSKSFKLGLCCVLSQSYLTLCDPHRLQPTRHLCPWGFSRQEYWSALPCPSPGYLPNPGIEPRSPTLQEDSLLTEPLGKP